MLELAANGVGLAIVAFMLCSGVKASTPITSEYFVFTRMRVWQ